MNILGVTLARGGSKSVPRKNVRPIMGKPLICYTIEEALKSRMLTDYIVSSDDTEILDVSFYAGAKTLKRPKELARDDTPHLPALLHAIEAAEERFKVNYEIVADIRCTNPLKTVEDIDGAINTLISTGADCVTGIGPADHPSRIFTIEYDEHKIPQLQGVWPEPPSGMRQDLVPETFKRNGSIYVFSREHLRSGKGFVGVSVVPWIMPPLRSVNIDDWKDFILAASILEHFNG